MSSAWWQVKALLKLFKTVTNFLMLLSIYRRYPNEAAGIQKTDINDFHPKDQGESFNSFRCKI